MFCNAAPRGPLFRIRVSRLAKKDRGLQSVTSTGRAQPVRQDSPWQLPLRYSLLFGRLAFIPVGGAFCWMAEIKG
jgi:hypothetical protein